MRDYKNNIKKLIPETRVLIQLDLQLQLFFCLVLEFKKKKNKIIKLCFVTVFSYSYIILCNVLFTFIITFRVFFFLKSFSRL